MPVFIGFQGGSIFRLKTGRRFGVHSSQLFEKFLQRACIGTMSRQILTKKQK